MILTQHRAKNHENIDISLYSDGIYYTWCNTIYLKKRAKNMDHDAYDAFDAFKRRIRRIQTTHLNDAFEA